jgi:DNA-binding LytR/AlgR family response regulator
MLRISIIDDDSVIRLLLKKYISQTKGLQVHCVHASAVAALEDPELCRSDIIILDVEMPQLSGIEYLEQTGLNRQIIMTSINRDYAVSAFDYNVIDFLFKPIQYGRFLESIDRARNRIAAKRFDSSCKDHIFIKNKNGYTRINLNDILYVEAYSDYMNIHTATERFMALSTMKAIEKKLPTSQFIRVHRSFLVHIDKIDRLEDNMIGIGEKIIPVSRSCKDNLLNRLNFF